MKNDDVPVILESVADEMLRRGPRSAQERPVLEEARRRLKPNGLEDERRILDCWQRLFTSGKLAWGHNLDNPREPFFHRPVA